MKQPSLNGIYDKVLMPDGKYPLTIFVGLKSFQGKNTAEGSSLSTVIGHSETRMGFWLAPVGFIYLGIEHICTESNPISGITVCIIFIVKTAGNPYK